MAAGLVKVVPTSVSGGATSSLSSGGVVTFSNMSNTNGLIINGCFTATYDDYVVVLSNCEASAISILLSRFYASGSVSNVNYQNQRFFTSHNTFSAVRYTNDTENEVGAIATEPTGLTIEVMSPAKAKQTCMVLTGGYAPSASPNNMYNVGVHTVGSAYDGIGFFTQDPVTASGQIVVYGRVK